MSHGETGRRGRGRGWGLLSLLCLTIAACSDAPTGSIAGGPIDIAQPWRRASPAQAGMDPFALGRAEGAAANIARVRSLLVARRGHLVLERYARGASDTTHFDVRSVTKSIVSALAGIALGTGALPSLDAAVAPWLAPAYRLDHGDSLVTIRALLTMSAGYAWNENSGGDYNAWIVSDDHVQYLLDRPQGDPGASFTYNSAGPHVLGVVLAEAEGTTLPAFARQALFAPLGVTGETWEVLDRGTVNGGAGIALTGRDLLRFGQLYLQHGRSGARAIIPESWVTQSTAPQYPWRDTSLPIPAVTYGMLWWVSTGTPPAYFAWGYGGQFVFVQPDRELVVVATTEWRGLSQQEAGALAESVLQVVADIAGAARD